MPPKGPSGSKRRRLAQLSGTGRISDAGLSRILHKLARIDGGSARGTSRRNITRAVELDLSQPIPYDTAIQTMALSDSFIWTFIHPLAMLHLYCTLCPDFAIFLDGRLREHPSTPTMPWKMVWYADEATPGNLLKQDNKLKSWCIYFSFLELGMQALSRTALWFVAGVIRTSELDQVPGRLSLLFRRIMELLFGFIDAATNILTGGFTFHLPNGSARMIFAQFHALIADEPALKQTWNVKGHAGLKPCLLCINCTLERWGLQGLRGLVGHSSHVFSQFKAHTNESIWQVSDRLMEVALREPEKLQDTEKRLGMNYCNLDLLQHHGLRKYVKPLVTVFDFLHVYLVNGLAQYEIFLFLELAWETLPWTFIHAEFQSWVWPRAWGTTSKDVFNKRREEHCKNEFKAGASETLGAYPILRFLILAHCCSNAEWAKAIASILALFDILDAYYACQQGEVPTNLMALISNHLRLFKEAYPLSSVRPKHHYAMHIPEMVDRLSVLLSCFVHERKHRVFTDFARNCRGATFEASIAYRLLNQQLDELELGDCLRFGTFLVDAILEDTGAIYDLAEPGESVFVSKICIKGGLSITCGDKGDRIFFDCGGGELALADCRLHVEIRPPRANSCSVFCIVDPYMRVGTDLWKLIDKGRRLISIDRILGTCMWKPGEGNHVLALLPGHLAYRLKAAKA